jgi:hypothetical protein
MKFINRLIFSIMLIFSILSILCIGCVFENTAPIHIDLVVRNKLSYTIHFSTTTVYSSSSLISVEPNTEFHHRIIGTKIPQDYTGYPSQIISKITVQDSNDTILCDLSKDDIDKYVKGVIYDNNEIPAYHWVLVVDSRILLTSRDRDQWQKY